jgi:hypothetical protein
MVSLMNHEIKVGLEKGLESECAEILIKSIGCVSELRFKNSDLNAIANLTSVDLLEIFSVLKIAESQRMEPNPETINALEHLSVAMDYTSDDQSHLSVQIVMELPITSSGSVMLEPGNMDIEEL